MKRARPVIAIDGPAGAGKSTAARLLAKRLGYKLVDTGALYRGVAFISKERGIAPDDPEGLASLARSLKLDFRADEEGRSRLLIDGVDRDDAIRNELVAALASRISQLPELRAALLELQRRFGKDGGVVLEGRDIGTVVFPDAEVKVFMTADPAERARRRAKELIERGQPADLKEIEASIRERDAVDEGREVAPLRPAEDAIRIDSTALEIDAVVDRLAKIVEEKEAGR
ncbi:MAG: (d)CMP kinase [Sandaracinaceae bacterium]|nr:(d)CMP kinase [Sandaracinaceae bacterium]